VATQLLIADPDRAIQRQIEESFEREGFVTRIVETGLDALASIFQGSIDLAVIELTLPDISGYDVCRRVRSNRTISRLPIIIYSLRALESDRIAGLEAGADDYLTKPLNMRELCLRARAVLRRTPPRVHRCFERGGVHLNLDAHRCQVEGREVQLTVREFELLRVLLEQPGRHHSRESLLSEVWGEEGRAGLRTVDAHISRLRNKLGEPGLLIQTVRGAGYRFAQPRPEGSGRSSRASLDSSEASAY